MQSKSESKLPELLAPAGDLEKLKTAVRYGADAVYLAGKRFGMRAGAGNFSLDELAVGIGFAHARQAKVYVTVNTFLHAADLPALPDYFKTLEDLQADAVILSDLAAAQVLKEHTSLPFHVSTQASCLNSSAARLWKAVGAERIILGREVSIAEAAALAVDAQVPVEVFVHGALCMAYAGACSMSAYLCGRDANQGDCVQVCRFPFNAEFTAGPAAAEHFLSTKDLCGLPYLKEIVSRGIQAVKIEGRMRSLLYVATVVRAYRLALDALAAQTWTAQLVAELERELDSVPHRDYTGAFLSGNPEPDSMYHRNTPPAANTACEMLGFFVGISAERMYLYLYQPLAVGDSLEILPFSGSPRSIRAEDLRRLTGEELVGARQTTVVSLPLVSEVQVGTLCRTYCSLKANADAL